MRSLARRPAMRRTPLRPRSVPSGARPPARASADRFHVSSAINPSPDPEAVAAVEAAARLVAELGHEVEQVDAPHDDDALARDFLRSGSPSSTVRSARSSTDSARPTAPSLPTRSRQPDRPRRRRRGALRRVGERQRHIRALDDSTSATTCCSPRPWRSRRWRWALSTPRRCCSGPRGSSPRCTRGKLLNRPASSTSSSPRTWAGCPTPSWPTSPAAPRSRASALDRHRPAPGRAVRRLLGLGRSLLRLAAQLEQAQPWFHRYADLDRALTVQRADPRGRESAQGRPIDA